MRVEFDRELLERVVARDLRSLEGTPVAARYRSAANGLYRERDEAKREDGFATLNLELFRQRGHAQAVLAALAEAPAVAKALERVLVLRASQRRDEDVDLLPGDTKALKLRLTADRFEEGQGLGGYLRRQLVYVADLLDPSFGYSRVERLASNPTEDGLLRDRYRLFWDLTVAGRLGGTEEGAREQARLRSELAALYARFSEGARERIFQRLVAGPRPTHAELLAAACDTERLLSLASVPHEAGTTGPQPGHPCPLCGFPTHAWRGTNLAPGLLLAVNRDFPSWTPERGICERCADLYELRQTDPWSQPTAPAVAS